MSYMTRDFWRQHGSKYSHIVSCARALHMIAQIHGSTNLSMDSRPSIFTSVILIYASVEIAAGGDRPGTFGAQMQRGDDKEQVSGMSLLSVQVDATGHLCDARSAECNSNILDNANFMEIARSKLVHLGFHEEPLCDHGPGMITVEVEPPVHYPSLSIIYLHPGGTLLLMDARTNNDWSCFTFGIKSLPVGSHFAVPISSGEQVKVQVADAGWLSARYREAQPPPPCDHQDTRCIKSWRKLWHKFREGGPLSEMQRIFPMLLYGTDYKALPLLAKRSRVAELRKYHYEEYLERIWAISQAAGARQWVAKALDDLAASSDRALRDFMKSKVSTTICDMLQVGILQEEHAVLHFNIHGEFTPVCNTHNLHDHGQVFASTLVFGSFVNNIYVGVHRPLGPLQGDALVNDSFVLRAARYERHHMRYSADGGCDNALADDTQSNELHVATFAGSELPYAARKDTGRDWGILRRTECPKMNAGSTYMMPFHWVHRPRRLPEYKNAFSVAVFDKVEDGGFGEAKLHSNRYNFSLATSLDKFREALNHISSFIKEKVLDGSPSFYFDVDDGGIAQYDDEHLGLTDDDTWY